MEIYAIEQNRYGGNVLMFVQDLVDCNTKFTTRFLNPTKIDTEKMKKYMLN